MAPGALHRARWMAKVIYSMKIFIFRSQFKLTPKELTGLAQFCVFAIRIYLPNWIMAPISIDAPRRDLNLIKNLIRLKAEPISTRISEVALKSFKGHLWYLSEILIGLAFFDSKVDDATKDSMVLALARDSQPNPLPRLDLSKKKDDELSLLTLDQLVTKNTTKLFDALGIATNWIQTPSSSWKQDAEYQNAVTIAAELMVRLIFSHIFFNFIF